MKPVVLLIAENHLPADGRAIRFANALTDAGYTVVGAGYERGLRSPPTSAHKFSKLITVPSPLDNIFQRYLVRTAFTIGTFLRPLARYSYWLMPQQWTLLKAIENGLSEDGLKPDVVIAKYWTAVPVALSIAKKFGAKFVYDANELSFAEREQSRRWRIMIRPLTRIIEKEAFQSADLSTTIGRELSKAFVEEYKLSEPPLAIRNIPDNKCVRPKDPSKNIKFIYSGHSDPSRMLGKLIQSVSDWKSNYFLTLQLTGRSDHIDALVALVKTLGLEERVSFIDAVSQDDIVPVLANYDVGLCLLPLHSLQIILAEPNKLHQYLRAGLPILSSQGKVFVEMFEKFECGIAKPVGNVQQIADAVNGLDGAKIRSFHSGVMEFQNTVSWDEEKAKLVNAIGLISKRN